jgi:AcrR family transcriptional regulator
MKRTTKETTRKRLDPAKTRESILNAALSTFAEKGFAGASIGDIAVSAKVQKSLVQYHFGSKEDLWHACVAYRLGPVLGVVERFVKGESSMSDMVRARFALIQEHPEVIRLVSWLALTPIPIPHVVEERIGPMLEQVKADPSNAKVVRLLMAFAAMDGWFLYRNLYRRLAGDGILDESVQQQMLDNVLRMVEEN